MFKKSNLNNRPPIVPVKTAINAFIASGYKSTSAAVSEIIDNSIEAEAKNIELIVFDELNSKGIKKIKRIVMVDDGIGMDENTLSKSLQFGNGSRLESRKSLGRFGIGLPNSSVSQCNRVDVYSWRNNKTLHTYLSVDEIYKNDNQNINEIKESELPNEVKKEIKSLEKNGTVVIWSDCARLDVAKAETLYNRITKDISRTYRYFLDKKNKKFKTINITYKIANSEYFKSFKPNDPMYLMENSTTPGYENQTLMALRTKDNNNEGNIEVKIQDPFTKKDIKANVTFRYSSIKPEIYSKERDQTSKLMNHLKKNQGISFVRAGREIDFGTFEFFDPSQSTERWWGCEIMFDPILDEVFGVSNNKQGVKNMNYLDSLQKKDLEISDEEINESPKLLLRQEISKRFYKFKNDYQKKRAQIIKDTPDKGNRAKTIFDKVVKGRKIVTNSKILGAGKSEIQKTNEWRELIKSRAEAAGQNLTPKQIDDLIKANKELEVSIEKGSWEANQFFTIVITGSTAVIKINTTHPFYEMMYKPLEESDDKKITEVLDLLLMSWARLEDELAVKDIELNDFIKIRDRWGQHLLETLDKLN
ncbi:ATP-binding protein [Pelagibacteraceae bacterium]|nr:ATP-binding protein [Pelagibacteraceae bacterium]